MRLLSTPPHLAACCASYTHAELCRRRPHTLRTVTPHAIRHTRLVLGAQAGVESAGVEGRIVVVAPSATAPCHRHEG
eukprot:scaffold67852_cov60-Phaeocystis_antarctica.AAC.2